MKNFVKKILMKKAKNNFLKTKEINIQKQLKNDFNIIKEREVLFKTKDILIGKEQKKVVKDLVSHGFSANHLSDVYSKSKELISYLQELCENTKNKTYEELVKDHSYDESKEYWVNLYHPELGKNDPIKEFMTSPEVFNIASKYLGEIPQIAMLSLLYTPTTNEENKNSMMWHLDNHNDNIVRMFINPYDMNVENGATMIFPNKYQPKYDYYEKFPYFTDEEAIKFGFNFNDKVDLIGESGQIYFADSANCFHCGSRSKKDRFVAILTFVPYLHYNPYKDNFFEKEYEKYKDENNIIVNYFKR